MKVLIIDDEEDFRVVASSCLGLLGGVDVVEAASGEAGIALALSESPDVILLDLCMPEMDGTETLRKLREIPQTKNLPVIFCTTKGKFDGFDDLKPMGALAVITKPFDPLGLAGQIENILRSNGYAFSQA